MSYEPSDSDKALFRAHMRTVKPLKSSLFIEGPALLPKKHTNVSQVSHSAITTKTHNHHDAWQSYDPQMVHPDETLSYSAYTIPKKRLDQLKKGQIPYTARLDLHGLRRDQAEDALRTFIETQATLEARCVLVIHGKGYQFGNTAVLKSHIYHCLQQSPLVLAFHSARNQHGGTGALYVLLKRPRLK